MPRKKPFTVLALALTAAIIGVYLIMALRFPTACLMGTCEDLYVERLHFMK